MMPPAGRRRPGALALLPPVFALACAACGDAQPAIHAAGPCDFESLAAVEPGPAAGRHAVGAFAVAIAPDGAWTVTPAAEPDRVLFDVPAAGPMFAAPATLEIEDHQGSFAVAEQIGDDCTANAPDEAVAGAGMLVVRGGFQGWDTPCAALRWEARLCEPAGGRLALDLAVTGGPVGRIAIAAGSVPDERVFGLGEQFPHDTLDLKGRTVPVLVQEGGIGRGEPDVTPIMDGFSPGSGGREDTTYFPIPHVLTSRNRSFYLDDAAYTVFDLASPDRIEVRVFADRLRLRVLDGRDPRELLDRFTAATGRMAPLPEWLDGGIVALARDLDEGLAHVRDLVARGARISAVWNQGWCGRSKTLLGEQVLWNWVRNPAQHPGWDAWVDALHADGIRVLCYVNPMFRDVPDDVPVLRDLYEEGVAGGYFVRDAAGKPYLQRVTAFDVALLDLTNPAAREWMKDVLKSEVLGAARCDGWMADFGEALPFDAVLASGESAATFHNRYPVEWARLNREAVEEAGRLGDVVVFHRSGFTGSAGFAPLFWQGDQSTTWDRYDGIRSALHGLLAGGFGGIALNHSDAGGYTSTSFIDASYRRTPELLARWVEMNAFTAVLRTHEGNQPADTPQVYSTPGAADHFARFTRVYAALAPLRRALMDEAAARGMPVVRHAALQFPGEPDAWTVHDQFLLGPDLLVAPVLEPCGDGPCAREAWLPEGEWVHLWTGQAYGRADGPTRVTVDAPPGEPPVFWRRPDGEGTAQAILDAVDSGGL